MPIGAITTIFQFKFQNIEALHVLFKFLCEENKRWCKVLTGHPDERFTKITLHVRTAWIFVAIVTSIVCILNVNKTARIRAKP